MSNFDRHAAINGGWISALAIGAIMMAAPTYIDISKQIAGAVFWAGVFLFFCSILELILKWHSEHGKKRKMWGPFIVMVGGLFIFCSGTAWYFWPVAGKLISDIDGTIKLECSYERFQLPDDGKLFELITSDNVARTISFQSAWMTRENYAAHPDSIRTDRGMINICRITNFNNIHVFNLKVSVAVQFSERNKETGRVSIIDNKKYQFLVPEIISGNSIKIYAWNNTMLDVILQFSENIELQRFGNDGMETVKLIPALNFLSLFPKV